VPPRPDIAAIVDSYKGREARAAGESVDSSPAAIEARVQRPPALGGVKVAILPKKTRGEVVYLQLTLRYGNTENLKGRVDAASFLPMLMTRATKKLDRQQIQDALDKNVARLGTGFQGGGGRRGGGGMGGPGALGVATFTVETKRANLLAVLEILRQILREPALPANEFEAIKRQRLAMLEQFRTEPQFRANNRLQRLQSKYPSDDVRYVPKIEESIERIRATSLEQVRELYRDYLGAEHGELVIVGDFEPSEIFPIVAQALEGWTASKPYARIERPIAQGIESVRETIETPDKANATYVAGLLIPLRDDSPDYPAMVAGNFILGGGALSSRLGNRLRQKEGLSYGAGSQFNADPLDARATLMMMAICNPANLAKATVCVDEELDKLLRDGITSSELAEAKSGYLRQQQVRRASDSALTGMLASHLYLGRTLQYDADLEKAIEQLTPEDVSSALRKYIDAKRLIVIGAGDIKGSSAATGN
jgi:zinc protease